MSGSRAVAGPRADFDDGQRLDEGEPCLQRGQTKSEVIRDAITRLAGAPSEQASALQRLRPFVGVIDSGGRQLSKYTGRKLRELLEGKRRARGSG